MGERPAFACRRSADGTGCAWLEALDAKEKCLNERRRLSPDEAHRLHEELLAHALPVRFAGPRTVDLGGLELEVPLVQLDASGRPEVDDLFRVVATESHQPQMRSIFRYLLRGGFGYMEINVTLADPVICAFTFVLEWPAHEELFALILMQEQLLFTTRPLNREHNTRVLGIKIERDELQPILSMWREAAKRTNHRP
jgi:hypothetical protein